MDAAARALPPLAQVAAALPFYAVVVLCCYSLAAVGHGLATFPDRPDAHRDLLRDIRRARGALAARGFDAW